jgi:hypothetical protein
MTTRCCCLLPWQHPWGNRGVLLPQHLWQQQQATPPVLLLNDYKE